MKRRSAGLFGVLVLVLASPGCEVFVSDGDYKVDPGAFAEGGTTGTTGASGASAGASGSASGTHSPEGGSGTSGTSGAAGASSGSGSGTTGTAGTSAGTSGAAGAAGMSGATGTAGTSGATGTSGSSMPEDASVDHTAPDAGFDAGRDTGFDAGFDAGGHPGPDAAADAAPNACAANGNDNNCAACEKKSCCTQLAACGADCQSLLTCVANCTETSSSAPCGCLEQYPNGVAEYEALYTCEYTFCDTPCPYVDTGDRCVNTDECYEYDVGVTCSSDAAHYGGWCTYDGCQDDSDCSNVVTSSGNDVFGEAVSCIQDGATSTCFPGCQSNADCAPFAGTTCQPATSVDSVSVMICALP